MLHSHRLPADSAAEIVTPAISKSLNGLSAQTSPATTRTQRAPLLTRRYETTWLAQDGTVQTATRLAPAIAAFEEAFSAFARGTLISTVNGHVAIEDLEPGMTVATAEGSHETITWIGSMSIYPPRSIPGMEPATLTRITTDAFGANRPMPDLILGPRARLLLRDARFRASAGIDAAYALARHFVDGVSIIEVTPIAPVTVFHIGLRRQATLRAAGLEIESYHPGAAFAELIDPQLSSLFLSLFPHLGSYAEFGPVAHPRLSAHDMEILLAA